MTTTTVVQYLLVAPDWKQSFLFKKKWNTGLQSSINNTEKRSELFTWPRRALIFTLKTSSQAHASYLRRILHKNIPYIWGVPIWQDGSSLTVEATSGQKVLACDTTYRNFEVGGQAIVFVSKDSYEVGTIDSLTDSSVTLVDNLTSTWSLNSQVYPILKGRVTKTQRLTWKTNQKPRLEIEVSETYDEVTRQTPSISAFPTYQDMPIFNTPPNWVSPIEESQIFDYELLQYFGTSLSFSEWENGEYRWQQKHSPHTKAKIKEIMDFFDYNKGRWGVFWRPSHVNDIQVTSAASAGAITIDIQDIEYTEYYDGDRSGLHVMLLWPDNTYQINSIKSSTGTTMTFNAGLSYDITAAQLGPFMISFLNLVRFNQDEIEGQYINDSMAAFSLVFQTALQETPAGITTTTTTTTTTTSTTSTTQSTSTSSSTTSTTSTTSTSSSTTTSSSSTTTTGPVVSTTTVTGTTTTTTTTSSSTTSTVPLTWLSDWAHRRKITVDNTNIDSDLTHFPIPVVLGTSVGQSNQDISDIFDEVGANSKKIAFTKTDSETQIHGEIEHWDLTGEKAVIWVSKTDLVLSSGSVTHLYIYFDSTKSDNNDYIGDTQDPVVNTVTGDTFDGTDGDSANDALWESECGAGCTMDIQSNKLEMAIAAASTSAIINSWFYLSGDFDIQYDFGIPTETTTDIWLTGFVCVDIQGNFVTSIDLRYISGKLYQSYIGTASTNTSTTDSSGKFRIVRSGSTITNYYWNGSSWTSLHSTTGSTADLIIRIRVQTTTSQTVVGTADNFLINSGSPKSMPSMHVWDDDYSGVYHMAQNPNGDVVDSILDSTRFLKNGTPHGSMTTADLINGEIGKAIELDGTDDYIDIPSPELLPETDPWTVFTVGYSAGGIYIVSAGGLTGDTWSFRNQQDVCYGVASVTLVTMDFTNPTASQWNKWITTRNGSDWNASVNLGTKANGTQAGSMRGVTSGFVAKTVFGGYWNSGAISNLVAGKISEIRFSSIERIDAWGKVEVKSIEDDLLTYSATENY